MGEGSVAFKVVLAVLTVGLIMYVFGFEI